MEYKKKLPKIKILIVSDSLMFPTGYSKQTKDLIKYLQKTNDYDIYHFSLGYRGKVLKSFATKDGSWNFNDITILPQGKHQFGADRLPLYINTYKPDICLIVADSFMFTYLLQMSFNPSISMFWFPSDGGFFPQGCEKVIEKINVPIAFTKYAQKQLSDEHNIVVDQCWEACDPLIYHKLNNINELKSKWSSRCKNCKGQHLNLNNYKILFTNARNQGRKMLSEDIKCFSKVLEKRSDIVLLFNCDPNDSAANTNLVHVAEKYGCEDRVLFTDMVNYIEGLSDGEVNELYNICDLFVLLTSGEGFGLPFAEASMVGKVVITTDYTNAREILPHVPKDWFIPLSAELMGGWNVNRAIADINKGSMIVLDALSKPGLCRDVGKLMHAWCMNNLTPSIIGNYFDKKIKEVLKR